MSERYEDTYHARNAEPGTHSYFATEHILPSYRKKIVGPWLRSLPGRWPRQKLLLDLAAGSGEFAKKVQNRRIRIVSADISMTGLQLTTDEKKVRANFLELPFPDDIFVGVHFKDALIHVPKLNPFFRETARVLKVGGKLLIVSHNCEQTETRVLDEGRTAMYYSWTYDQINEFANRAGLFLTKFDQWREEWNEHDWYTSPQRRDVFIFEKCVDKTQKPPVR